MTEIISILVIFFGGFVAGSVGGLLGIGGGIVLVPLLRFGVGLPPALTAGTCVFAVLFTTLGGSYRHYRSGRLSVGPILPIMAAGLLSSVLFSLLFIDLVSHDAWMDLAMGLVFALISGRMIIEGFTRSKNGNDAAGHDVPEGRVGAKVAIGAAGGVLPGILGIGTGGILVPAFTFLLNTEVKRAMAASLLCFALNAFVSATFKAFQGMVVWSVALPACVGTFAGANVGAILNRWFSSASARILFGVVFTYVAVKFIMTYLRGL